MEAWSDEGNTDPLPRGGVGDAYRKEKEQKEMSSSVYSIQQARFSGQLDATRCSDELKSDDKEMRSQLDAARCSDELKSDQKEMSTEDVDAARRSVDAEGDPIRYNALAKAKQQPALAVLQRLCVSFRPNLFVQSGPRVGIPGRARTEPAPRRCRGPDFDVRGVAN